MFSFKGKWRECFIYYTTMDDGDDGRWMMDDGREAFRVVATGESEAKVQR